MTKNVEKILFSNIYRIHVIFLTIVTIIQLYFILVDTDVINDLADLAALVGFSVIISYLLLGIITLFFKDNATKWCKRYSFLFVLALILIIGIIIHIANIGDIFTQPIGIGITVLLWSVINPILFWIITDKLAILSSENKKPVLLSKILMFTFIAIALILGTLIIIIAPLNEPLSILIGVLDGDSPFFPISIAFIIIAILGSLFLSIEFILSNKKINKFIDSFLYIGIILLLNGIYLISLTMMALENHLINGKFLSLSLVAIIFLITLIFIWFIEYDKEIFTKFPNIGFRFIFAGLILTNITSLSITDIQQESDTLPFLFLLLPLISMIVIVFLMVNSIPEKQKKYGLIQSKIPAILGIFIKKDKKKKSIIRIRDKDKKKKKRKSKKKKITKEEETSKKEVVDDTLDSNTFDDLGEEYNVHLEEDDQIDDHFFELLQDEELDGS